MLATWIDEVPHPLVDNTIILAVLALITGILLLIDAGVRKGPKKVPKPESKAAIVKKDTEMKEKPADKKKKSKKKKEEVEEKPEKPAIVRVESHETQTSPLDTIGEKGVKVMDTGISSVEIRIKEPKQNWPEYKRSRGLADLDVLTEAEKMDDYLQSTTEDEEQTATYVIKERSPRHVPNMKTSPIRHTSSYYINGNPSPFAWQRLREQH
jgi:hypothetical protein